MVCCLYIGSSRERFDLLKFPQITKTESGFFCSVSVIGSASFFKAELTCACRGMSTHKNEGTNLLWRVEQFAVNEERF